MSRRNRLKKRKLQKNEREEKEEKEENHYPSESIENDYDELDDEREYNDNERGEYFEADTVPLQRELVLALTKSLNIPTKEVYPIISNVFSNISPHMLDDYTSAKPSNSSWKIGEDSNLVKKVEPQLLEIREEMEKDTPTIPKILQANVTKNDKKKCLRLFDQMKNVDQYSEDYFRFIDSINEILSKGKHYSKQEILFLEAEEDKLRNTYVSLDSLKTKILKLEADASIKSRLLNMYDEMLTYPPDNSSHTSLREEIEWSIRLPYQKREIDPYIKMNNVQLNTFYSDLRKQLDEELYGMDKVKNRILHVLNDRRSSGESCGRNICLVGSAGTGKTQICKALAKVLNKKFAKISAGALDSAAIKGTNKVWTGSEPSIVLQILATLKTNNAIIMFDEVDKLGDTPSGKLSQHALLHVSDPVDNKEFQDNYLKNFSHDLSKVLFIYCMNNADCLDAALKDRFDIIYVDDYTNDEKLQIFKNYMLPRSLETIGLKKKDLIVEDAAIKKLLEQKEIGLRSVEKIIKDIVGKVNMYRNIILPDGSLGQVSLNYKIPNFKIPLRIDYKLLDHLINF